MNKNQSNQPPKNGHVKYSNADYVKLYVARREEISRMVAGAFDAGRRFAKGQKDEDPGKHFCLTEA
ncbi:hypothetical protein GCO59_18380 [Salmonella enterica]|nr:hypothetical protein [Salmonella enterica]HBL9891947.1 hypothetical protein [Salmonella enterica subsp. enterica serovar Florida]